MQTVIQPENKVIICGTRKFILRRPDMGSKADSNRDIKKLKKIKRFWDQVYTPFQIRKITKLNTHALKTDDLLTCVVIFSPHKASNLTSLTLLWLTYFGSHLEAMTPEIHAYSPRLKIKRVQTAWRRSSSRRRQSVCRYLCLCRACMKIKQARMTGKRLTRVLTVHLIFLLKK